MSTISRLTKEQKMDLLQAEMEQRSKDFKELGTPWRDQEGFNTVSLGDYLEICRRCEIPHVPAEKVATIDIETLYRCDPADSVIQKFVTDIQMSLEDNTMLRWDCCAPMAVKMDLSRGEADWKPELLWEFEHFHIENDARAFDLIYEYPAHEICVWKRPWIETVRKDGYPIEYRAYVDNNATQAISNYYPQRPLEWNDETHDDILRVIELTQMFVNVVKTPMCYPYRGRDSEFFEVSRNSLNFTCDFMKTKDGLLFLEGGPPMQVGAHPCCFNGNDKLKNPDQKVLGVAIALEGTDDD